MLSSVLSSHKPSILSMYHQVSKELQNNLRPKNGRLFRVRLRCWNEQKIVIAAWTSGPTCKSPAPVAITSTVAAPERKLNGTIFCYTKMSRRTTSGVHFFGRRPQLKAGSATVLQNVPKSEMRDAKTRGTKTDVAPVHVFCLRFVRQCRTSKPSKNKHTFWNGLRPKNSCLVGKLAVQWDEKTT